jgi:glycerophosphoryl diester phosphodiesterase
VATRPASKKRPLIVAHRGSSGEAPENTVAAFKKAIEEGADMIELDVRLTKDFFLVVHHDQDVKRTTGGKGYIWDMTLEELRSLDAGSWFGPEFKGEGIPTLRRVMDLLPPHMTLNMEVKTDGEPRKYLAFEEACILAILEKHFENRVIVSSFDHSFIKRVHELYPSIKTGALYMPVRDIRKTPSTLASNLGVSAFICSYVQLHKRHVDDAHKHKMFVAAYSVNKSDQLRKAVRFGVDAVVTDYPGRIREMLVEMQA